MGGKLPPQNAQLPPQKRGENRRREGEREGEGEGERERERRERERGREREREEEREGYYTQHSLNTYGLLLHVALLEVDWLLPSFTTNLSIAFVYN